MSLNEICRQYNADHINSQVWKPDVTHGAICKMAKNKKWEKNLAERVKQRVQEKLVTGRFTDCAKTEEQVIEQAAQEPVEIATGQRVRTQRALLLNDDLMMELRDQFEDDVKTFKKGKKKGKRPDLTSKAKVFRELSTTMKALQDQQAQQYKLNDSGGDGEYAEISVTVDNYGD